MGFQGPSGILQAYQATGPAQVPSTILDLVSAPLPLTITDKTQRLYVSAQVVLTASASTTIEVQLCSKWQGGFFAGGSQVRLSNVRLAAGTPTPIALSGIIGNLDPGPYWVGLCAIVPQPALFNTQGDSYTNVLLLQ
jgi:hypothetical protein